MKKISGTPTFDGLPIFSRKSKTYISRIVVSFFQTNYFNESGQFCLSQANLNAWIADIIGRGSLALLVSIMVSSVRFSGGVGMGVGKAGEEDENDAPCCLGGEEKRERLPDLFVAAAAAV